MSFISQAFSNIPNTSLLGTKMDYLESTAHTILNLNLDGDVAECGVYKGGSARLLATMFPNKKIFLFDSFEGMLESDTLERGHQKGDFRDTSLEQVRSYLSDKPNCSFFPGWIPSSASFLREERFCLVHLDLDLYQSTKAAIEIFWPKIVDGGVIVFDDWEWQNCPGVKQSITEYFDDQGIQHKKKILGNVCNIFKV
jgi:O-methyltransferase